MTKLAYVFPGQGSQSIGMGKELYANDPRAKAIFDQADQALGFALTKIIFEGPESELQVTYNAQPAILTTSIAMFATKDVQPNMVAGHSLGEYSALVAAGAIDFADAVRLVRFRGQCMERAVPGGKGAMAAILGLDDAKINEVLSGIGQVQIANYNCPGQTVISGEAAAVKTACEKLSAAGAKRAIPLNVSGPFHSALMQPAAEEFKKELAKVTIRDPKVPIVANVTAEYVTTAEQVREMLYKQVYSSVRWTQSIEKMIADGVSEFIEVGPGSVLTGLIKKIKK